MDKPVILRDAKGRFPPGVNGLDGYRLRKNERKQALRERCDAEGFDWVKEAIARFRDETLPPSSRDFALKLIVERLEPKLRSIVLSDNRAPAQVSINIMSGIEEVKYGRHEPAIIDVGSLQEISINGMDEDEEPSEE